MAKLGFSNSTWLAWGFLAPGVAAVVYLCFRADWLFNLFKLYHGQFHPKRHSMGGMVEL